MATNEYDDMDEYITPSEFKRIYRATIYGRDKGYALLWKTLWNTGRRISEVTGLHYKINNQIRLVTHGLRPIDLRPAQPEDGIQSSIRWQILKKNSKKRMTAEMKKKFLNKYTPTEFRQKLIEHRVNKHETAMNESRKKTDLIYRETMIPCTERLMQTIIKYIQIKNIKPHDRIFPYTYYQCRYKFEKYCKIAQVYNTNKEIQTKDQRKQETLPHLHMLRSGYATRLANKSRTVTDIMDIKRLLRHSNIATTEKYLKVKDQNARELQEQALNDTENDN